MTRIKQIRLRQSPDGIMQIHSDKLTTITVHALDGVIPGYLITRPGAFPRHIPESNVLVADLEHDQPAQAQPAAQDASKGKRG